MQQQITLILTWLVVLLFFFNPLVDAKVTRGYEGGMKPCMCLSVGSSLSAWCIGHAATLLFPGCCSVYVHLYKFAVMVSHLSSDVCACLFSRCACIQLWGHDFFTVAPISAFCACLFGLCACI